MALAVPTNSITSMGFSPWENEVSQKSRAKALEVIASLSARLKAVPWSFYIWERIWV
jgi:hypothetical protein